MANITLTGILYYQFFVFLFFIIQKKSYKSTLLFSSAYFLFIGFIAIINYEIEIIDQKDAKELAFLYYSGIINRVNSNFGIQAFISAPGFWITGAWEAAIGVNIAVISAMILTIRSIKLRFILIFFAPSVVHLSLFTLRDIIMSATIYFLCQCLFGEKKIKPVMGIIFAFLMYLQRPELLGVLFLSILIIYSRDIPDIFKPIFIIIGIISLILFLPYVPVLLGFTTGTVQLSNVPNVIASYFEARSGKWEGTDRSSSAILGGSITSMPLLLRYPIQFFTFFISPLPVDFRGFNSAILFLDSLFFCVVFRIFWKISNWRHRVFVICYIAMNAFFIKNYGNMFRLRVPCYFIMLSGFVSAYHSQIQIEAKTWLNRRMRV